MTKTIEEIATDYANDWPQPPLSRSDADAWLIALAHRIQDHVLEEAARRCKVWGTYARKPQSNEEQREGRTWMSDVLEYEFLAMRGCHKNHENDSRRSD
jgi:hypothetical protein